jgi:hypothetical protein
LREGDVLCFGRRESHLHWIWLVKMMGHVA